MAFFEKHRIAIVTSLFIACFLFFIGYVSLVQLADGLSVEDDINFDTKIWKKDSESRVLMLFDLEENFLKVGMTKKQIEGLLGKPDGGVTDGKNFTWENEYSYDIGIVFLDPYDYVIEFDKIGKVRRWSKIERTLSR